MISQKQIAERLGLSRSLVSKVLNNKLGTTKVNQKTAQAIINLARELGYKPNPVAVSLATRRFGTIGVVVRGFGTPGSRLSDVLTASIGKEARQVGQKLVYIHYDHLFNHRDIQLFTQRDLVDGLLFAGTIAPKVAEQLSLHPELPAIGVCSLHTDPNVPRITIDNVGIGRLATHHLIERGCRRIAVIATEAGRTDGFRQAMRDAGLAVVDALIFHDSRFVHTAGSAAVEHFLKARKRFDGVVAQSDEQAAAVVNVLMRRGIGVPEQVKVIGVDNAPFCDFTVCPLTSVDLNLTEAGRTGVRLLMDMIAHPGHTPPNVAITPFVVQRRSTELK